MMKILDIRVVIQELLKILCDLGGIYRTDWALKKINETTVQTGVNG